VKKLLFFFIAFIFLNLGYGQITTGFSDDEEKKEFSGPNDSTVITEKSFDENELQRLKSDPYLNYKQAPTVAESLWDRLMNWLGQFIDDLFQNATTTGLGRLLVYVLVVILIIVIIMMLLRVDALRVFYSGADKGNIKHSVFHENIHEMDFEKLIREATEKGEYRLGVRLIFLYALKTLADKQLIDFQAGKTNHDYVDELAAKELKTGLNELSFYFDYAWYGGFSVDKTTFSKVEDVFKSWKCKVS
jgi:hypothetical protein